MTTVELSWREVELFAFHGVQRRVESLRGDWSSVTAEHQTKENYNWDDDIHGAIAEAAVAKYFGRYPSGVEAAGKDDLPNCEIRST